MSKINPQKFTLDKNVLIIKYPFKNGEQYMNDFYVYAHYDPTTKEVKHVGKGRLGRAYSFGKTRRYSEHRLWLIDLKSKGLKPIVKYIKRGLSEEEAFILERETIIKYKNMGFNLNNGTLGGKGAFGRSWSKESRSKLSASLKGKPSGMLGKKHSGEVRKKMSISRLKIRDQISKNMSVKMLGSGNHRFGKPAHNIRAVIGKNIITNEEKKFSSIKEAAIYLSGNAPGVHHNLTGKTKTYKSWSFYYEN